MNTLELLQKTKQFLGDKDNWTQWDYKVFDKDGKTRYCAVGAMLHIAGENIIMQLTTKQACKELYESCGRPIYQVNDDVGYDAVMDALDKTILRLSSEQVTNAVLEPEEPFFDDEPVEEEPDWDGEEEEPNPWEDEVEDSDVYHVNQLTLCG